WHPRPPPRARSAASLRRLYHAQRNCLDLRAATFRKRSWHGLGIAVAVDAAAAQLVLTRGQALEVDLPVDDCPAGRRGVCADNAPFGEVMRGIHEPRAITPITTLLTARTYQVLDLREARDTDLRYAADRKRFGRGNTLGNGEEARKRLHRA